MFCLWSCFFVVVGVFVHVHVQMFMFKCSNVHVQMFSFIFILFVFLGVVLFMFIVVVFLMFIHGQRRSLLTFLSLSFLLCLKSLSCLFHLLLSPILVLSLSVFVSFLWTRNPLSITLSFSLAPFIADVRLAGTVFCVHALSVAPNTSSSIAAKFSFELRKLCGALQLGLHVLQIIE